MDRSSLAGPTPAEIPARVRRCPSPSVPPVESPAAFSPGQVRFLASLTAAERAYLARWPRLRSMLLQWNRHGPDAILASEAARLLRPAVAPTQR